MAGAGLVEQNADALPVCGMGGEGSVGREWEVRAADGKEAAFRPAVG